MSTTKREWLYAVLALTGGVLGALAGGRLRATVAASATQLPPRAIAAQEIRWCERGRSHIATGRDACPTWRAFGGILFKRRIKPKRTGFTRNGVWLAYVSDLL
jgi:hypothetical protein